MEGFLNFSKIMESGIYALVDRGKVVYIGQARRMIQRLAWHYNAKIGQAKFRMKRISFEEIWIMPVPEAELDAVEARLIFEHQPRYNKHRPTVPLDIAALIDSMVPYRRNAPHPWLGNIVRRI